MPLRQCLLRLSISDWFASVCVIVEDVTEICELEVGVDAVGAELGASHDEVNTPSAIRPPEASASPVVQL